MSRDDTAELALNNIHSLAQIHIYFICIVLSVHNTEAYYVETFPVVQKQPDDQYDIAHYVGTIPVVHVVNSSIISSIFFLTMRLSYTFICT